MNEQNTGGVLDLDRLERLEKAATPVWWSSEHCQVLRENPETDERELKWTWALHAPCEFADSKRVAEFNTQRGQEEHDALLLSALRNAARALIARARRADELEQEARIIMDSATELAELLREKWSAPADIDEMTLYCASIMAGFAAAWKENAPENGFVHCLNFPDHGQMQIEVRRVDGKSVVQALKDRDAEIERLKSAWQERENEALTLRAANADFARSFSDLQDELAAGRKDTERMDQVERLREEINNIEGPGGFPEDTWVIWRDEGDMRGEQVGKGRTLREAVDATRTEVKP